MSFQDYVALIGGQQYPLGLNTTWSGGNEEPAPAGYEQMALRLFADNPVVFSAVATRLAVFSQARLRWRRFQNGRPQNLFGDQRLSLFERPWPGGTTADLLARMIIHADLGGNAYVWNSGRRLHLWRPDWVSIVLGSNLDADHPAQAEDVEVVGYLYHPGGPQSGTARLYLPGEVAHFAPTPDPLSHYRGMSWLTPVIREIQADKAATEHKFRFFENAATPNLVIKFDPSVEREKVKAFKELVDEEHAGTLNAYKTLYLGGGADATVVGANMQQLEFAATQGKGETRIAMASGVPAVVLGASEGLQGSSLNAGNYQSAKRAFSDIRLQHLWNNAASSLGVLVPQTSVAVELAFDTSAIPFLQDDLKDTAEIQQKRAQAIRALAEAGYEPDSVVEAVNNDDLSLLQHTGVFSVQLQPPGSDQSNSVTVTDPEMVVRMVADGWTIKETTNA